MKEYKYPDYKAYDKPLNAKQMKFVQEFISSFNATQAAIKAGYDKSNARELVNRCRREITRQLALMNREAIASGQEVLEFLTSVMRGEIKEQVIIVTNNIVEKVDKECKVTDRLKAAEALAKHYGLLVEATPITVVPILEDDIDEDIDVDEKYNIG